MVGSGGGGLGFLAGMGCLGLQLVKLVEHAIDLVACGHDGGFFGFDGMNQLMDLIAGTFGVAQDLMGGLRRLGGMLEFLFGMGACLAGMLHLLFGMQPRLLGVVRMMGRGLRGRLRKLTGRSGVLGRVVGPVRGGCGELRRMLGTLGGRSRMVCRMVGLIGHACRVLHCLRGMLCRGLGGMHRSGGLLG